MKGRTKDKHGSEKLRQIGKISFLAVRKSFIPIGTSTVALLEGVFYAKDLFSKVEETGTYIVNTSIAYLIVFIILMLFSVGALLFTICDSISEYKQLKGRIFLEDNKDEIRDYLTQFIEKADSVAILSHDMSWINDDNRPLLEKKAESGDLLLFLPEVTKNVQTLKDKGADIRCFGNKIKDPAYALIKSRMTVVNWNKTFPKLTYPIKKDGLHYNREFEAGEPANLLALDLINALLLCSENEAEKGKKYESSISRFH